MDSGVVLCGIGVVAAFGFGAGIASLAMGRLRHASSAARVLSRNDSGGVARVVRNGVAATRGIARFLLRFPFVDELAQEGVRALEGRGMAATRVSLLSAAVAVALLAGIAAGVVTSSAIAAVAVCCCICACFVAWARSERSKRQEALRDAVPEALSSMGACFRSGYSLLQTFRQVASETTGPLSTLFERAAHRLEVGQDSSAALEALREGATVPELSFVAVALDVQRQTGGSMQRVLAAASETVEGQIELRRSLRVQTAQAQLSARVVSLMPFILVAVMSLLSEGFLDPFFESVTGLVLLGVALAMELAGVMLVRRMLRIEVS